MQGIDPVTSQPRGWAFRCDADRDRRRDAKPGDDHDQMAPSGEPSGQYSQLVSDVVLTAEEMM